MNTTADRVTLPPPGVYTIDPDRSVTTFATRHLFGIGAVARTFAISNAHVVVVEPVTQSTVTVEVDAGSFRTGSASRDTKVGSPSFLAVEDHPSITFVSSSITRDRGAWTLPGVLTVRGQSALLTVESATNDDGHSPCR